MGRDEEFSSFVTANWARMVRAAVLLGCSVPEAEDVTQTALMRCLVHWDKVERADDRGAYVHRVLVNTFASSRRRFWNRERATSTIPEGAAPDPYSAVDQADAVTRALKRLPTNQRLVVVLRYYLHLDEAQMSSVLGVAPGTVKSRLSRALKTLAENEQLAELRGAP